ncbi:MAG: hypothetical protein GX443_00680 [Deltaproteobacteria bacterium]|nr:hypothetical protein [Deltaproteobacteria bacterium]
MALRVSRSTTLGNALRGIGLDPEKFSSRRRALPLCAQCHVT